MMIERFEALLDGPSRGNVRRENGPFRRENGLYIIYQDYKKLYDKFSDLARTFRKELIPQRQLDWQNQEQVFIPYYQGMKMKIDPNLDAIDRAEKEEEIYNLQEYTIERWEKLEVLMKALCKHEYVHLMSSYSHVSATYNYGNYTTLENVDDFGNYNVPPWDLTKQTLVKDLRTNETYRRALMRVVCQE